jgi:plasmid stabilization system protein ParE
MVKEIVWTETSVRDRLKIYEFWLEHNKSPVYSNKLENLFNESAKLLAQFSQIGIATDYLDVRIKLVRNYKLFYKDTPTRIEILRVWDTRQDPNEFRLE